MAEIQDGFPSPVSMSRRRGPVPTIYVFVPGQPFLGRLRQGHEVGYLGV